MARVFISHAAADETTARRLKDAIEKAGHAAWLATDEILVGDDIPAAIGKALADCDGFVVCWSTAASGSPWVGHELSNAQFRQLSSRSGRVLPVRLDDLPLPAIITAVNAADLFPEKGWQRGVRRLLRAIDKLDGARLDDDKGERAAPSLAATETTQYRAWTRNKHRGLDLIGVDGGDRALSLDHVFVPLHIASRPDQANSDRHNNHGAAHAVAVVDHDVKLEDVFRADQSTDRHAILFGDPGSGKTTALLYYFRKSSRRATISEVADQILVCGRRPR